MKPTFIGDIKGWINSLDEFKLNGSCKSPTFLKPYHFVMLGLRLSEMNANVALPESLSKYATRMHLWTAIGKEPPEKINEGACHGRFAPLERLDDRNKIDDSASDIAKIARCFGADDQTERSISISMSEIMENCFAHGEIGTSLIGLACAQSWPKGSKAQVAIADLGVGIRESLTRNADLAPQVNSINSCEFASRFGVTSKPEKGHAGYGLALARQLLAANGGTFMVVSHDEWFCANGPHVSGGSLASPWPGTLVVLEWNTNKPLRVRDVYDSWPLPEGFNDDDFDF